MWRGWRAYGSDAILFSFIMEWVCMYTAEAYVVLRDMHSRFLVLLAYEYS